MCFSLEGPEEEYGGVNSLHVTKILGHPVPKLRDPNLIIRLSMKPEPL